MSSEATGPLQVDQPVAFGRNHKVDDFDSGVVELDDWLRRFGWVNHVSGNARVFVAAREGAVVGYYTLSSAGVAKQQLPAELTKGGVPTQVPCVLLGRLAVDRSAQGAHLGRSLLIDALIRVARLSDDLGVRALLIHARDEDGRAWYTHQARSFQPSPTDPLHLVLPIKELRRIAGSA